MMQDALVQMVITVWLGVHPVTYTLPDLYRATDDACQTAANNLFARRKPGVKMTIECIPTNRRAA